MTFNQFVWLDALVRAGGALYFYEFMAEENFQGHWWPQFRHLRDLDLIAKNGRNYPYIITERGKIAHALQAGIYARQAAERNARPHRWKAAA